MYMHCCMNGLLESCICFLYKHHVVRFSSKPKDKPRKEIDTTPSIINSTELIYIYDGPIEGDLFDPHDAAGYPVLSQKIRSGLVALVRFSIVSSLLPRRRAMASILGSPAFLARPLTKPQLSCSQTPRSQQPIRSQPEPSAQPSSPPTPPPPPPPPKPQQKPKVAAESTDWIASSLTRRFGLGAGLAWVGFLAFGVVSEQIKTRLEVSREQANTRSVLPPLPHFLRSRHVVVPLRLRLLSYAEWWRKRKRWCFRMASGIEL